MKRHNIELLIAWLDALRRRDLPALTERLDPQATWQGVRLDLVCHGREEIVQTFVGQRDEGYDVDALELIGAADHAILHARAVGAAGDRWRYRPRRDVQRLPHRAIDDHANRGLPRPRRRPPRRRPTRHPVARRGCRGPERRLATTDVGEINLKTA